MCSETCAESWRRNNQGGHDQEVRHQREMSSSSTLYSKIVRKGLRIPRERTLWPVQTLGSEDPSGELQGESEEPQSTESKDDADAWKDFWSIHGNFIHRPHIEPRVQLFVLKSENIPCSSEIPTLM